MLAVRLASQPPVQRVVQSAVKQHREISMLGEILLLSRESSSLWLSHRNQVCGLSCSQLLKQMCDIC